MTAILREDPPELPETVSPALRQIVPLSGKGSGPSLPLRARPGLRAAHGQCPSTGHAPSGKSSRPGGPAVAKVVVARPGVRFGRPVGLARDSALSELDPIDLAAYRFTPFANDHEAEAEAAWSPDGKSIAYLKTIGGIAQLMVRALDSAIPIQLTKSPAPVSHAFWSPDSTVVYCTTRDGKGELFGISPSGGKPSASCRICAPRQFRRMARRSPSGAPPNRAAR